MTHQLRPLHARGKAAHGLDWQPTVPRSLDGELRHIAGHPVRFAVAARHVHV